MNQTRLPTLVTSRHSDHSASCGSYEINRREAVLQREIARLMQERDELRSNASGFATMCTNLNKRVDFLQAEVDRLSALDHHHQYLLSALYNSHSWKLAAPLRAISILARSLFKRRSQAVVPALLLPPTEAAPNLEIVTRIAPATLENSVLQERLPRRRGRGDLFVVSDLPPLFDRSAGALRLFTLLGLMAESGWTLTFAALLDRKQFPEVLSTADGLARYENPLRQVGVQRILYGTSEIDAYLAEPTVQVDWAFLSFPTVASTVMPLVRVRFPKALIAFDMVDFHGVRMAREAELLSDPARLAEALRTRDEELGLAMAADVTLAVTEEEKAAVQALAPQAVVKVLPCVFDIPKRPQVDLKSRAGLFFIGGFWHAPNGDGIKWFVDGIWPFIRAEIPDVVLRIAGSDMGDDVLALGALPGIEVLGYIPEVPPLLDRHRVFIAPLRYGAGMKGKVGQSLASGLPVVATKVGAEGMGLLHGTHILVADEEEAFAGEVVRLLRDDELWERLSVYGSSHIQKTLSRDAVREKLEAVFSG